MADVSVFSRLKRLFSADVIIRNVGGRELKVTDINKIQTSGKYETNSLVDRFTRLYQYNAINNFNPNLNYQTLRTLIYTDYDAMDTDPIIHSALDVLADEATLKSDLGEVLTIKSSDENIQRSLNNLFYDILNINFNLWSWIRQMCKYGDFFLKIEIAEEFGVYNVLPYTVYHITRHEGENIENPTEVYFKLNMNGIAGTTDTSYLPRRDSTSEIILDNYEIAHFRLLADTTYLPYGRSYIEGARKVFKQLSLMEDAMLIHRIMRSPEKRTFFINVGSIPPNEVEQFMQQTINQIKKEPYVDPKTGQYNLRFNLQNMMEDFYIPVRGGDTSTRIDTTKGLDYDGIKDVEYLRDKMFAALKIPKAYMGYEKDLTGKCIHPDTEIRLLDGTVMTIKQIADIFESNPSVELYTYSYDFITDRVVSGKIVAAEKTRKDASLVKVWIDNDTYVITTPDHGFLLQDGTRIDAQDLQEGATLRTIHITEYPLNGEQDNQPATLEKNYKVDRVEHLSETIDTYNMEVYDENENHNYLLANDIVIKNSTLAAEDIRFARTVERIQRVIESELTKIALVHLYVQGFKGESLVNFDIKLTTPSTIYEQEKIALYKEKVELANQMITSNLFPSDFIYEHIFNLTEDKFLEFRDLVKEDKRREFRLTQIENEGNDPVESGKSYGTPHDLASIYRNKGEYVPKVPAGYSEKNPEGRPVVHHSIIGTHADPVGGMDRMGQMGMKDKYVDPEDRLNENKVNIYRNKDVNEESSLLDESNILDLDIQ